MFRTQIVDNNEAGRLEVTSHLGLPLYGRFKSCGNSSSYLLCMIAGNTASGLMPVRWGQRLLEILDRTGVVSDWLFQHEDGWRKKMSDFNEICYDTLYDIQRRMPTSFLSQFEPNSCRHSPGSVTSLTRACVWWACHRASCSVTRAAYQVVGHQEGLLLLSFLLHACVFLLHLLWTSRRCVASFSTQQIHIWRQTKVVWCSNSESLVGSNVSFFKNWSLIKRTIGLWTIGYVSSGYAVSAFLGNMEALMRMNQPEKYPSVIISVPLSY
jgi:hypothetical protein